MNNKINILGVNIDNLSFNDTFEKAKSLIETNETDMIFTPNPEIIMLARNDETFENILNSASICTPDGIGVVYGAKILKTPLVERVAGFDLATALIEYASQAGKSIFLFGAAPNIADTAAEKLIEKHSTLKIAGTRNGYFKDEETPEIIEQINQSNADILFACLGAPKQEKWIYENRDKLNVKLALGLGGALDVFAGNVKRAPKIFIKLNLEWFYRLLKQPSRIGRFMALPKFMITVMRSKKIGR
ncbi:MAG: WecB/TagA/CpsF family glycosyltransferase [Oscillospiraceae bacterium]|nr:WecB/TagA/CpsF family glycosyltransferase [Oscillospiraceae bacterium]